MTLADILLGAATSILTTWLTQSYALKTHLEVKRAEAEAAVASRLRAEKKKRYLAIVRNLESLYDNTQDKSRRQEFLTAVRELWLLGDQDLVRKLRIFLVDIAQQKDANPPKPIRRCGP